MNLWRKYLRLFLTMLKIGAFTFGGGIAMLALLENEFVTKRKYLSRDEFLDMTAIAESTPGPIAINAATYIGFREAGIIGATFATLGVVIPSFTIIFLVSLFFNRFLEIPLVGYAFQGIRVCVVYLIFSAGIKMLKGKGKEKVHWSFSLLIVSSCILLIAFTVFSVSFSSVYLIAMGAVLGLFCYTVSFLRKRKRGF